MIILELDESFSRLILSQNRIVFMIMISNANFIADLEGASVTLSRYMIYVWTSQVNNQFDWHTEWQLYMTSRFLDQRYFQQLKAGLWIYLVGN